MSKGSYEQVCTVEADTSTIVPTKKKSPAGETYYTMSYEIVLLFGLTELKAQIAYKENVGFV